MRRRFPKTTPVLLLLIVLSGIIFVPSLHYPLLWDDAKVVRDNHLLRQAGSLSLFFQRDFWRQQVPISRNDYRPVQMLALSLIGRTAGMNPAAHRFANVLLHALVTAAAFALSRRLLGGDGAALAATALFALHPVHVEAVVNARNISELIPTLILVWILAGCGKARGIRWAVLACPAYAAALLTKETSLILPPLILLVCRREMSWRRAWRHSAPFWVLAAAAGSWKLFTLAAGGAPRPGSFPHYPLEAARLLGTYARLLVFPFPLKTLYPFRVEVLWTGMAWAVPLAGAAAGLLWLGRARRRQPRAAAAAAALLLSLLPALSKVAQIGRTVAEQRLYFPSVFYCILIAALFVPTLSRLRGPRRVLAWTAGLLAAAAMVILGQEYLQAWRSEYALWLRASILSPRSSLAFNNLAIAYHARDDDESALAALREALALSPEHCEAHNNLGVYYRKRGQLKLALEHFHRSLDSDPNYHVAALNLAELELRTGQPRRAEAVTRRVIEKNPYIAEAHNGLAIALEKQGRVEEAVDAYRRAFELNGEYAVPLRNLALLLQEEGRYEEALDTVLEARRVSPRHPGGFSILARLYVRKGKFSRARRILEEGLDLNPGDTQLRSQLLALPEKDFPPPTYPSRQPRP